MPSNTNRRTRSREHTTVGRPFSDRAKRSTSSQVTFTDAKRVYERYVELARAAASAGDPIETENFYQHAEHYFRLMRGQAV